MNSFKCIFDFLFVLVLLLALSKGHSTSGDDDLLVTYSHGTVRGRRMSTWNGRNVRAFLGMPYAKPPTEERRFQNPDERVPHWKHVRDAALDGPICAQWSKEKYAGDENCLFINVYTPQNVSSQDPLPVLFYIHGGFLAVGSSHSAQHGPDILLDEDIVLVTFNYRLGVLGFLSTEDKEARGNFGFKDQVAALKWTKENIRSFGGDPEHVTIGGHSAGSCSVGYHLHSPMSKGLFQRAILLSSASDSHRPTPPGFARRNTELLAQYVDCPTATNTQVMMKCLREKSIDEIFGQIQKFKVWQDAPAAPFRPVLEIDGGLADRAFITNETLHSKSTQPIMIGITSEDGLVAAHELLAEPKLQIELNGNFAKYIPLMLRYDQYKEKNRLTNAIKKFYLQDLDVQQNNFPAFVHMCGDVLYWRAVLEELELHEGPAYLYYYTHKGTIKNYPLYKEGVGHGDEINLLFPRTVTYGKHEISESDKQVSRNLVSLVTGFVQLGEKFEKKTDIYWEKLDLKRMNYLHIEKDEFTMKSNMLGNRTVFWKDWLSKNPMNHDEL